MSGIERRAVVADSAPPPAGTYSSAIAAAGLIFVSGQTPRRPDGYRLKHLPFKGQVDATLSNLEAVAAAAGASWKDALFLTVYLVDPENAAEFDRIYRTRVVGPPPARAIVQSSLTIGALEITAIFADPCHQRER